MSMRITQALAAAADDVRAVRKDSKNEAQRFNFRGIDAVMNACGPAFRRHSIICVPVTEAVEFEPMQLASGKTATRCIVRVRYVFYGPEGDSIDAVVYGESFDMGDKALAKAYSVAYRTCLLQTLTIPTDDPDPNSETFEAAPKKRATPKPMVKREVAADRVDELYERLASLTPQQLEDYGAFRVAAAIPKLSESITQAQADEIEAWLNKNV